ncbi:MAG: isopentenyl phosphate kinase [Archaeoglobaceae archaeon]|nr:isopentenyl phosphate kinase [Archaeoglobaceae archaeon]MCX8152565.1 isopentenyl phosphate kinase [Archaeoglobaceae archaeon]MDW8014153.1 isopentenyl phosphate kinase [Archaeoglobaceae archaeon]
MKVLKIGGSVITDKSLGSFEVLKKEKISEICEVIAEKYDNLVVVHGVGSFGHPHVKIYGLKDQVSISKIHLACLKLNQLICEELLKRGVPALPIHPIEGINFDFIKKSVNNGFVPVLHGDVTVDSRIISGDDIAVELAEKLNSKFLGFATDVDGIILNGKVIKKFCPEMLEALWIVEKKIDVTGGMRKKVEKILSLKTDCRVFIFKGDAGSLRKFLNFEPVGTEICRQ